MRRRQFLHGIVGATACGIALPAFARRTPLKVGIVGGGIVGASIAMHLAEAGADVVLFEKAAPAAGATRNSFAWLNAFVADRHYQALRLRSLAAYHARDVPLGLDIVWGGYVNWARDAAEAEIVRANAAQLDGTRNPARLLSAAGFAALDPALEPGPIAAALFSSIDGHLDPIWATGCFLKSAREHGARTIYPCELQGLRFSQGRLAAAQTSNGEVPLERLVVAAGVDTPQILAMAGFKLRLLHAPGFLMHSTSLPALTRRICDGPGGLEFKQMADGTLVGGDSPEPPDLPVHAAIREHAIDFPDEALRAWHGTRVLDKIKTFLPGARGAALGHVTLGFRPMPTDGLPIVGAVPGATDVYVAVTHSGVTLAPILGEYMRMELLHEQRVDVLAPYRPGRFTA
ncbi:MAG: NAD(P)/FAD-dependent oxidoreductase [Steroidobacteraceae bacterium]